MCRARSRPTWAARRAARERCPRSRPSSAPRSAGERRLRFPTASPRRGEGWPRSRCGRSAQTASHAKYGATSAKKPLLNHFFSTWPPGWHPDAALLRDGFELVADSVARLDERVAHCAPVDFLPELADEDVDSAVAVTLAPAPELLQQLVTADDATPLESEGVQDSKLRRRELRVLAVDVGLDLGGVDAQLLDLDRLAVVRPFGARPAPSSGLDAGDELVHGERLDEVVVRADVECVHAVVLRAARADDDDRRSDPLAAGLLDQPPAVDAREHQIDDAHIGPLEPESRQASVAVVDDRRIEAGSAQVRGHALGDDLVVLDDQHLRHTG